MTTLPTPDCEGYFNQPQQAVYYRLYRSSAFTSRRLLLLHGGGVDGQITWEPIVSRLLHWSEVLGVPKGLAVPLRESKLLLRDARLKGGQAAWEHESAACRPLLEEARRVWAPFRETEPFLDASPDLVLGAPGGGERGN